MANRRDEEIAQQIILDFGSLMGARGIWEIHWQEIAMTIMPNAPRFFQAYAYEPQGYEKTEALLDSTGMLALNRFGAIMDSMLTPQGSKWHRIVPADEYLAKQREVRMWCDDVTERLFFYRGHPLSNFVAQNQQIYRGLAAFGTAGMFVDQLSQSPGIRYKNINLRELFFSENHQGIPDRVYRKFRLTARAAMTKQLSGEWENLSPAIVQAAKTGPEEFFDFIHAVIPNKEAEFENIDYSGMPYTSYYLSMTDNMILSKGGYISNPYIVTRYDQWPDESYGRSPAMDALPTIKTLNLATKLLLRQAEKASNPVLLTYDDSILSAGNLTPGAINVGGVNQDGKSLVQALPVGRIDVNRELIEDQRNTIRSIFMSDLFQLLIDSPRQTATEVVEKAREKGILLAPTMGKQETEYLGPLVAREIDCLVAQNLLPPPPAVVKEAGGIFDYKVSYESPLARLRKAEEVAATVRSMEFALNMVNITQDPTILDTYDVHKIVRDTSYNQGMPEKYFRSQGEVDEMRKERQQQAQVQQAIEALPGIAQMTKATSAAA